MKSYRVYTKRKLSEPNEKTKKAKILEGDDEKKFAIARKFTSSEFDLLDKVMDEYDSKTGMFLFFVGKTNFFLAIYRQSF